METPPGPSRDDAADQEAAGLPDPPADPPSDGHRQELEALPDEELVERHREGDDYAFHLLVERYRERLRRWLTRKVADPAEAEDLVQKTLMRVYRHLHRFDTGRSFSTWIFTIAGNLAKNVFRNRARDPLVLFQTLTADQEEGDRPLQWADRTYLPDEMTRRRDLRELVDRVVRELPEHQRTVFLLREREGRTYQEIADITGLKLGTVKSRLNRARRAFAAAISEHLEEPVPA